MWLFDDIMGGGNPASPVVTATPSAPVVETTTATIDAVAPQNTVITPEFDVGGMDLVVPAPTPSPVDDALAMTMDPTIVTEAPSIAPESAPTAALAETPTNTFDNSQNINILDEVAPIVTPEAEKAPEISSQSPLVDTLSVFGGMDANSISDVAKVISLDEKIAGFVAELESLQSNEEMILSEKEAAIADLERKKKALQEEVREIKSNEKKIEATIASLTGKEAPVSKK